MTQFFIQLLNASIAASWLIGAVLLVRLIIKGRSPRWIACLLWGLVALRLVIPFSVESPLSLVPETPEITLEFSEEAPSETESIPAPPVSEMGNASRPTEDSSETEESEPFVPSEEPSSELSAEPSSEPSAEPSSEPSEEPSFESSEEPSFEPSEEPDVSEESYEESSEEESQEISQESSQESSEESEEESTHESSEESLPAGVVGNTSTPGNPSQGSGISFAALASGIWLAGVLALAGYALVNYFLLKQRVLVFVPDERGFRRCEGIDTPFVLGFFRPRIYLPYGLSPASEPYIIAHEKAHIKRMDHLVKPIAYCILALHWFNPLVWIAFVLFCKDIEYACDEKVLKNAAADIRKEYATALLECASKRSFLAACPIAFGEVSVKERVKKTMNYKRPLLWVIIVSVLLCALVAVLFFTAPMDEESAPNTPSEEQTSSEASTEPSTEESTESSTEESAVTEPSEPEESQPEESQPDESEPEVSEPEESEPEVSEPEVSDPPEEPVIPPSLELPPETETKLEKEFRFEIGVDHPWAYTATYHDFGAYADPEFPISFYGDQKGNYYGVSYSSGWWNRLVCLNNGETLPYKFSKTVSSAIFDEELVYVTTEDGYVRVFDISEGLENGVLTDEWNPWDRFGHDGVLRLYNGEVLFFSKATTGPVCTLDGEPIERKDAYQYVTRADQIVTKLEDGTFAVFRDKGVCSHYATCNSSEWLGLEHQVQRTYTDQYSTRETAYTCHGANGEVVSRVLISEDRSYWYEPCNIDIDTCTITHYKPHTVRVNGIAFENTTGYNAFWGPEGKLCVIILYPDHGEFYTVTGITHAEMTPVTEENAEKPEMPAIITIHSLEREDLVGFLEDPAGYAWDKGWIRNIPADGVPGHVTQAYDRIYFRPDFLELYNDHAVMERYLLSRGVSCTVTKVAFFESMIAPFTLYVETADGTLYFIGVEDHTDFYTYTLYTEKEYVGSFLEKPIKIVINGKELQSEFTFCRYGEYAEIPFIATMDALGADLYWRREGYAEITMGANTCYVDTRDSSLRYGGVYHPTASLPFSPKYGDEIILRTDTLQEFFKAFCHGVTVRVDAEESVVYIDNQYADTIECYFSPDGKSVLYAVWNEDEAYDWYRIVGDGEPEALPIDIQPYRDSMKRWANDFSVVYFTDIDQSTFLSCLYKWDENGEVSLLSETCDADALGVLYEDGSFYFQEISHVTYDTFIENDLGEAGEEFMAQISGWINRMATVYYYDGNEKKLAAENVWCDATGWDPYAAEASGGAYLTLDPGEKVKLSAILEIVGENRNVGWLDTAMRAFAKCTYTVKDQCYTVDLDRASVAIIAKDAKHLAVLSDWDPHTEFGTLYLVKIGEQGVEEVTLISEKITSKEPMRMNAYFSGSNYLVYRADGAERDTYVQIGDQS